MVNGVFWGLGVGCWGAVVGVGVFTGVLGTDTVVGVGMEVEITGVILGAGVDWQAVSIKLNNKIISGCL
jgi:hypothetical protein